MIPGCDCGTCCAPCGHYPDCALVIMEAWDNTTITTEDIPWFDTPNC